MARNKDKVIRLAAEIFNGKKEELNYVNDSNPGIRRVKKGKGWCYYNAENKLIRDERTLQRIKRLVLPPAWKNVWICSDENGHLQATGIDAKGRKQYKYHPAWVEMRNETKFDRMLQFGSALPVLREQVDKDLRAHDLGEKKVIALVIHLMDKTAIRIGNSSYEKMYGSFGLTTLRDKHVKINGSKIHIRFKGKKGVQQDLEVSNARLARLVKKCRDIPGQELFQYYDENGERKKIDSGTVNHYIKEVTGENFSAKDFRTWKASVFAVRSLMDFCNDEENHHAKKDLLECLDQVSKRLGNTRNVCKKYYVHPAIISKFDEEGFAEIAQMSDTEDTGQKYYRPGEGIFLKILESQQPLARREALK